MTELDMDEFDVAVHHLCLRVQECERDYHAGEFDYRDAEVSYEEYLRNGGEPYDTDDLMDVVELVPLEELDYDTVPATLERCLAEGF